MQNYNDYENLTGKTAKVIMMAGSLAFILLTVVGGVLFWLAPKQMMSADENRNLAVLPIANQQTLISGEFEKQFEAYYNDHFIGREYWIDAADQLKTWRGTQSDEFKVLTSTAPPPAADLGIGQGDDGTVSPASENDQSFTLALAQAPIAEQAPPSEVMPEVQNDDDFNTIKGVVVTNGRVVQQFGGSKATLSPFADMVSDFKKRLGSSTKVYAMLIPAGSDFYLPQELTKGKLKERENVELLPTLLAPDVIAVNAYNELAPHTGEYIMFRTDHHWTGLGAYYAYVAFAKAAGFVPLSLHEMTYIDTEKEFLGSLYNYTHEQSLKKYQDTLEYYKIPGEYDTKILDKHGKNPKAGALYYEKAGGYPLFLGGDYPMVHIHNANVPTKKLLMVKDSFGNALATYFPYHYSDVYVVDFRHFKGNLVQFMQKNDIDEFLYAHNTFAANAKAASKYGNAFK